MQGGWEKSCSNLLLVDREQGSPLCRELKVVSFAGQLASGLRPQAFSLLHRLHRAPCLPSSLTYPPKHWPLDVVLEA